MGSVEEIDVGIDIRKGRKILGKQLLGRTIRETEQGDMEQTVSKHRKYITN